MEKGDRVKLSEEAKRCGLRRGDPPDREGTVIGAGGRWINVHWDGLSPKTIYSYHRDYIAPAQPNGEAK